MTQSSDYDSATDHVSLDTDMSHDMAVSGLLPQKKELHAKFIRTLQKVLPRLSKDEGQIISALIILALKIENIIGKDISNEDAKLIGILKDMIMNDSQKRQSTMNVARRILSKQID